MSEKLDFRKNIWNVPNVLTMVRLALIPVYWVLFLKGLKGYALLTYLAASLTDVADGRIARKYNMVTDFGKLMDPAADKLMVVSVMLSMVLSGTAPLVPFIVLFIKEFLMMLGASYMLKRGVVVYAKWSGKLAQLVVVTSLILCFFADRFAYPIHHYLIWAGVALAVHAFVYYVIMGRRMLQDLETRAA